MTTHRQRTIGAEIAQIGKRFDLIILFSLFVTAIQQGSWAILSLRSPSWFLATSLGITLLLIGQMYALATRSRFTWILSAVQLISIFFFSVGTFGYLVSAIFKPFEIMFGSTPTYAYAQAATLILLEGIKTIYFYRTLKK